MLREIETQRKIYVKKKKKDIERDIWIEKEKKTDMENYIERERKRDI